jgi:Spy/CpxP family protein refolding chaperone
MFNRKTFLSVSLASALMVAGVNAAFADHCDKNYQEKAQKLKKELNLTDDQTKKIQDIFADAKKKHESLREDTRKQVRDVLTDEQKKKFDELKSKKMDKKS